MPVKELNIDFAPKIDQLKLFTKRYLIGNLSSMYIAAVRGLGLDVFKYLDCFYHMDFIQDEMDRCW